MSAWQPRCLHWHSARGSALLLDSGGRGNWIGNTLRADRSGGRCSSGTVLIPPAGFLATNLMCFDIWRISFLGLNFRVNWWRAMGNIWKDWWKRFDIQCKEDMVQILTFVMYCNEYLTHGLTILHWQYLNRPFKLCSTHTVIAELRGQLQLARKKKKKRLISYPSMFSSSLLPWQPFFRDQVCNPYLFSYGTLSMRRPNPLIW